MIAEAFMICALAPAPAFVMHSQETIPPVTMVVQELRMAMEKYPRHHQRLGVEAAMFGVEQGLSGLVLAVGGDPVHLKTLREYHFKAFGAFTEDYPGITKFHAVTDAGSLSFSDESFIAVFWHHLGADPGMNMEWLVDATALVMPGGFFLFDEDHYPHWMDYLIAQGWIKHPKPHTFQLSAWQRPFSHIAAPAYGHFKGRHLLIYEAPKWKMRWGLSRKFWKGVTHAKQGVLRVFGMEPGKVNRALYGAFGRCA